MTDKNESFSIIVGFHPAQSSCLGNVYAPNYDNAQFDNILLRMIPNLNKHLLIFGGDSNCAIDPVLDRSATSIKVPNHSPTLTQNGYIDPWRFHNRQDREYFFFHMFITHILIYIFFFIDGSSISSMYNSEYFPIVISDDALLALDNALPPYHTISIHLEAQSLGYLGQSLLWIYFFFYWWHFNY